MSPLANCNFGMILLLLATLSLNTRLLMAWDCHCPLLLQSECNSCAPRCTWNTSVPACRSSSNGGLYNYTSWNGYIELGQTHVVKAVGENRTAPKVIAEREAEMLFTATNLPPPTPAPTAAPTGTITQDWGLEQLGVLDVALPNGLTWPSGYPSNKADLLVPGTEYYIPNVRPDVNINFDLNTSYPVQGVYIQTWYVTTITQIQVGLHNNDGYTGQQPKVGSIYLPPSTSPGWKWFNGTAINGDYNVEQVVLIPKISARYVQIRLRGGSSSYSTDWGLRQVKISKATTSIPKNNTEFSFGTSVGNISYKPPSNATIRVAAYASTGALLGVLTMRNATQQRPLLEQSLTITPLSPYSNDAWSATLPWNWMREGTLILVGTSYPTTTALVLKLLKLSNLAAWGQHTLSRTKVLVFGNASNIAALDTTTYDASLLAKGMFNSMPLSELRWEDTSEWYLPYLVVHTSKGPKLVYSESERRQAMQQAGDTIGDEPPWQVLKEWGSIRHRVANIGVGLSRTTEGPDYADYASGTSIFMGWALSSNATGPWNWDHLGYWDGWSAAAWVGWCGMVPGDECGNTLIHELGHSQTMGHFVDVRPEIAAEYPLAGVNMPYHPWGYDTTSRRFRTWYKASDPTTGKNDPMNGGEDSNMETCFPQYTAYHSKWSQEWAWDTPVLLAAGMGEGVTSAGAYIYSKSARKYEKLNQETILTYVNADATLPVEVSVPVATIFGTIGNVLSVCQIYPALFGSAGNTFALPSPFTANLPSVFTNAAHYVEIRFKDGTSQNALIAVPKTLAATELRHFSLTVAVSRQPVAVDLYRYNNEAYPSLSSASVKTLLYSRSIDISSSSLNKALRGVVRVGRGWLGGSTKMTIGSLCTNKQDCLKRAASLKWTGSEGGQITYESVSTVSFGSTAEGSKFTLTVIRQQDGLEYNVTILASRIFGENGGTALPLLDTSQQSLQSDAVFGVTFSIPYDLNKNLAAGTYRTNSTNGILSIKASQPDGTIFASFDVMVDFKILAATGTADLSYGKVYTSSETFYTSNSFVYFLVADASIGPTTATWCGGDRDTLTIPMVSSCTDQTVTAVVMAQQLACGSYGQMSSGRGANNCGHKVVLTLDPYSLAFNQNTWLAKYPGCLFTTHPVQPISINAFRWHDPEAGKLLGSLILNVQVNTTNTCIPDPATCGCGQQADYRGNISVTVSGKTCQAWSSQSPQQHTRTPANYPNSGLDSNFCRNPDGEPRAWCYTMDPNTRWELCAVPFCGSLNPTSPVPKPTAPVPKPTAPVPTQTAPASTPIALVPKPTAPVPKPTAPVPKPTAPLSTPIASFPKPTAPAPKPTAPVPKPTAPVSAPIAPVPKPTTPVRKPAAPVPVPNPTAPVMKPVNPFAAPVPKPVTGPVLPTSLVVSSLGSSCGLMEENVSFPGNDIATATSSKAEGCCSVCANVSGCKAFSWSNGTCYLKSGKGGTASSTGTRSAVLGASYCASRVINIDFYGNDIASVQRLSADECCLACKLSSGCTAFTWSSGTCWIKATDTSGTTAVGAVSGTVWL